MQAVGKPTTKGRAQVDRWALPSDGGPRTQRQGAGDGGKDSGPDIHPAAAQGHCLDNLGDPLRMTTGHQMMDEQSDQQPAECWRQKNVPPR